MQKVQAVLNDRSIEVAKTVQAAARAGDMQAAGLVLARVSPALRSQAQPVQFEFDPSLPIGQQIKAVLAAVAAGEGPTDLGHSIIAMIGTQSTVRATENLERRMVKLEAKVVPQ